MHIAHIKQKFITSYFLLKINTLQSFWKRFVYSWKLSVGNNSIFVIGTDVIEHDS